MKVKKKKQNNSLFATVFLFFFAIGVIGLVFNLVSSVRRLSQIKATEPEGANVTDYSGLYRDLGDYAYFDNQKIATVPDEIFSSSEVFDVLGLSDSKRWVEIDLSDQKISAWDGDDLFLESLVSTGKWGRTPTGEFRVWMKLRYTKMEGGDQSLGTYYYLPNVPYTMFFAGSGIAASRGYALHGTYWHNNFGTPMSHGCVNLPNPVAEKLFYWAGPQLADGKSVVSANTNNPGLRVVIHK